MKFRVQQNSPGQFEVLNGEGEVLFMGTLSACESWLDQQEGAQQQTWKASLGDFLRKLIGKASSAAQSDLSRTASPKQKPAP